MVRVKIDIESSSDFYDKVADLRITDGKKNFGSVTVFGSTETIDFGFAKSELMPGAKSFADKNLSIVYN